MGLTGYSCIKGKRNIPQGYKKNFWDIDALLDLFTIEEIVSFYQKKYLPLLAIGVAHMVTYFADAEESDNPNCLKGKTWTGVKKSIYKKINNNSK